MVVSEVGLLVEVGVGVLLTAVGEMWAEELCAEAESIW